MCWPEGIPVVLNYLVDHIADVPFRLFLRLAQTGLGGIEFDVAQFGGVVERHVPFVESETALGVLQPSVRGEPCVQDPSRGGTRSGAGIGSCETPVEGDGWRKAHSLLRTGMLPCGLL